MYCKTENSVDFQGDRRTIRRIIGFRRSTLGSYHRGRGIPSITPLDIRTPAFRFLTPLAPLETMWERGRGGSIHFHIRLKVCKRISCSEASQRAGYIFFLFHMYHLFARRFKDTILFGDIPVEIHGIGLLCVCDRNATLVIFDREVASLIQGCAADI